MHTKEKPFACAFEGCDFRSADSSNLKTHARIHTGETPFVCSEPDCGYSAAKFSTVKRHSRTHTEKNPLTFKRKSILLEGADHATLPTHTILPKPIPVLKYEKHSEKSFVCTFKGCGYRAIKASYITGHARAHTGDKPFLCNWDGCRFRAKEASTLKNHTRMHTGLQLARMSLFSCSKVGCAFLGADSKGLSRHLEGHAMQVCMIPQPSSQLQWTLQGKCGV
jgi:uncharacterized Zn-finger protein